MKIYSSSSILLQTVLMSAEFDKAIDEMMENLVVNTSAAK